MTRIHQLPSSVVTKIAAGEVIERPASVVKELLENSVDAGSTRIEIDVEQGGTDLIRIVDNGHGIHLDDLPLAFSSHATSKLTTVDDLFHIDTFGFRGEALASIGGVSQVSIQSRPHEQEQGAEIRCHGGELSSPTAWNGSPGTRIEVKHLFYNTPVRKKFLRTTNTEMGHVTETFTRVALAHPQLHLILRHNGRVLHELPPGKDRLCFDTLKDRIGRFFGEQVRDKLYEIEATQENHLLRGFIADPSCDRGNGKLQYLFLNGRWIKDKTVSHATQEAYRGLLMTGRYAVTFLFLELPTDLVDVNVHPTKSEVRWVNSQPIYRLVNAVIKERLRAENLTAKLQPPPNAGIDPFTFRPSKPQSQSESSESYRYIPPTIPEPDALPFQAAPPKVEEASPVPPPPPIESSPPSTPTPPPDWPQVDELPPTDGFTNVIQLYNAYLVMETDEGMLVIDQHALHERILFEQFQTRIREGNLQKQPLLIPDPVELTAEQAARTLEHREALSELGLEIEDFGGNTIVVTAYPALMQKRSPGTILKAVVDHLMTQDRPPTREVLLNDLLSLMACHSAVRAGDHLTSDQMLALIAQRHLVDDTHHCPHGRPTALLFTREELDRQFRRI